MLKLLINQIIFLCILGIQVFCIRKFGEETYKKKKSYIFVALYCIFILYQFTFGYADFNGNIYAINLVFFFVFGMFFSIKQIIFIELYFFILLIFSKSLYGRFQISMYSDFIISIIFAVIAKILKTKIYKESFPSILSSISYGVILPTLHVIIAYIIYIIFDINGLRVYDYLMKELLFGLVFNGVCIVSSICVINAFYFEENKKNNNLLKIFVEKYNILIFVFCIFALLFSFLFNFFYINRNYKDELLFNYNIANSELKDSYDKYGNNFYNKDVKIQYDFDSWAIELAGGVYLLDENFNKLSLTNEYEKYSTNKDLINGKNFVDIINLEKDKILNYKYKNYLYYLIYNKIGNNYLVVFMPYSQIFSKSLLPTSSSLFVIILYILIVFLLIYYLFKNFVVNRIRDVNKKLDNITKGNYNEKITDMSSDEFKDLSNSINMTVDALKTNISKIEKKNEEELELSRRIQVSQLPMTTDVTVGYSAYGINIPAEDVGGDFYDNFSINSKKRMFLVSDVSGKGIPGAMFMMKAKHTIVNFAKQYDDISVVFDKTNKILSSKNDTMMFVTCFAFTLNLETGNAYLVNAGHNTPIIIKNEDGEKRCEYLDIKPCRILGIDEDSSYIASEIKLNEGDTIVLYTDGVTEAQNKLRDQYGINNLMETMNQIKEKSPKEICNDIVESVKKFADGASQSDDITIYCIKYNGDKNVLKYEADMDSFDKGKNFLMKFISLYNINVELARNLRVVYDEIFCNISRYAYNDKGGELVFELNLVNKDTLEMVFRDKGPKFDPVEYNTNMKEKSVDEKVYGGMGIMFCMNIMEKAIYERQDGYNILKMYKKVK